MPILYNPSLFVRDVYRERIINLNGDSMDASLPKIGSYEKYLELMKEPACLRTFYSEYNMTGWTFLPSWPSGTSSTLSAGTEAFPDNNWNTTDVNECNYWMNREVARFCDGGYTAPGFFDTLRYLDKVQTVAKKLWWHFLHVSNKDPSMVAFTPSWEYGLRDRQVILKVGKYLTKFYGEVLSPEEIRDIVNRFSNREILWAKTPAEMVHVYENGPNSCMSGPIANWDNYRHFDGQHPIEVYGYVHDDGAPEFNVAYLMRGEQIVARTLVAMKPKVFVRTYGDDGMILQSHLEAAGFTFVSDMSSYGLRLKKLYATNGCYVMPYLDGNNRGIVHDGDFWKWTNGSFDYYCEYAEGLIGETEDVDSPNCDHCGEDCDEDDLRYSEHHQMDICDFCRNEHYTYAYYGAHGESTYVRNDDVIFCESNDEYYRNDPRVLNYHDIVYVNGSYFCKDDDNIFRDIDGGYQHTDDQEEYLQLENSGDWVKRDDITNEFFGKCRHGAWFWYHPDDLPTDHRELTRFVDDFGDEHTRWQQNPAYYTPGQLWSMFQHVHDHEIHDLCGHIDDLGEEWETESTSWAPPTPGVVSLAAPRENIAEEMARIVGGEPLHEWQAAFLRNVTVTNAAAPELTRAQAFEQLQGYRATTFILDDVIGTSGDFSAIESRIQQSHCWPLSSPVLNTEQS